MDYIFNKQEVNLSKLTLELSQLNISGLSYSHGQVTVHAIQTLDSNQLDSIQTIINDHIAADPSETVRRIISNAMQFGNELMITFAAENVLMGITQLNKTKDVSDYLANVTRYIQTGSLHEVINEVNRLIANGLPEDLAPFITETRLLQFKQKILDYLN